MINKNYTYAVVGASNDSSKYGNKVFLDLLEGGYRVIPINPKEAKIAGEKVYRTLSDFEGVIDVVIFVVPPAVTEKVLAEVLSLEIKNVWMQPGSESDEALEFCKKNNIRAISNSCIMVQRKN